MECRNKAASKPLRNIKRHLLHFPIVLNWEEVPARIYNLFFIEKKLFATNDFFNEFKKIFIVALQK